MSQNDQISEKELTEKIQRIGHAVYDKIHFGVPFQQPNPTEANVTFSYMDDLIKEVRPFAMARNGLHIHTSAHLNKFEILENPHISSTISTYIH